MDKSAYLLYDLEKMKVITSKVMLGVVALIPELMMSRALGAASDCPPPASAVEPKLEARVSFDKTTGLYTYVYTASNGSNALLSIDYFDLNVSEEPREVKSAPFWKSRFTPAKYSYQRFSWSTSAIDPAIANEIPADNSVPPALYAIKPGSSLSGFELKSDRSPGIVEFNVSGDDFKTPGVEQTCPGYDPNGLDKVTGMIVGPSEPGLISVKIRTRDKSGLHHSSPIDPKNSKGQMGVLVLSSPTFDASQVNISSVVFGPAKVAPVSSELIPTKRGERLEGDEISPWEKAIEGTESKDEKKRHSQNLLLTFDVASLDVQCGIDQALFLRGETKTGQKFIGAAPAKVVGCKAGQPGVHKPKKKQGKKQL